ncbi:helix-turn-helix transcriptional regulator [Nocardioides alkalitolerans]|uniref:helix-turn-helix transcriptional regulator n=1 Tax=Nocardioides alkalitolerans TaxID=281714 RepID=UPI0003F622EA|nr:WYL domain-containing protein [Nocardioides alkalitolerans]
MSPAPHVPHAQLQVARLLALVPYLHSRGAVHLEEAARDLGVPPAQIVKDLRVLLMCGLPGGYPDDLIDVDLDALLDADGDRVIRVSNADYLDRPLRLTPTEASALVVALRSVRSGSGEETRAVVDRTLAKLEGVLGRGAAVVEPGLDAPEEDAADPTVLTILERGVAEGRQVRLTYHVHARDEVSARTVDPRGVAEEGGRLYLDAWCHAAEAPRLFRVDRIHDAELLETPVVTAPEPVRDLSTELFVPPPSSVLVTLRLGAEARWFPEYYPVEETRTAADGSLEVDLHVADRRWLERLLLRLAPAAHVVRPREFTEALTARAQATLSLYE